MPDYPELVQSYRDEDNGIAAFHSTRPKIVVTAGASGSRLDSLKATTDDASDNKITVYRCKQMTLQSAMGTGALVDGGGGSDTLTRSSGDFETDGWQPGMGLLIQGATTEANNFFTGITGVASGTLTMPTAMVDTAENLPAGAILWQATPLGTAPLPAGAGTDTTNPAVDLLSETYFLRRAKPQDYMLIGADEALACAVLTAMGAAEFAYISAELGDY